MTCDSDHRSVQPTLFDLGGEVDRAPAPRRAVPMGKFGGELQAEIDFDRLGEMEPGALPPLVPTELKLPATRGECRGPGICPMFRCRHNLALRVKSKGGIKVDGGGPGTTLRPIPLTRGAVARRVNRMVDAALERIERLGTSCSLDLIEQRGRLSIEEVAEALGVTEEIVRLEFLEAQHGVDIALKREARAEKRALNEAPPATLVQIRRKR